MNITPKRTEVILNHLRDNHYLDQCSQYGEPGYQDPEAGILFANWNPVPGWIQKYLEEAGYELEWSDEWYVDYNYGKAYRTSADSYHWQCQIHVTEAGEVLTPDNSDSDWVEEFMMTDKGHTPKVLPSRIDPTTCDFEQVNDEHFENGWHPGQTDDPKEIAKKLFEDSTVEAMVFRLSEVSQFYVKFDVFARRQPEEEDEM